MGNTYGLARTSGAFLAVKAVAKQVSLLLPIDVECDASAETTTPKRLVGHEIRNMACFYEELISHLSLRFFVDKHGVSFRKPGGRDPGEQ